MDRARIRSDCLCLLRTPGFVQFGGHQFLAGFQVYYVDRRDLLPLPDPVAGKDRKPFVDSSQRNGGALLEPADLAASRVCCSTSLPKLCARAERGQRGGVA